jgi:hypothetical protein
MGKPTAVAPAVMTKSMFAHHVKVTPARVSQWLADGSIGVGAIIGTGRGAMLVTDAAVRQIRARRDPGQGTGLNGLSTQLETSTIEPPEEFRARGDDFVLAMWGTLMDVFEQIYRVDRDVARAIVQACNNRARELTYQWELEAARNGQTTVGKEL